MRGWGLVFAGLMLALPAWGTTAYTSFASMETANPGLTFASITFTGVDTNATSFTYIADGLDFIFTAANDNGLTRTAPPGGWPAGSQIRTNTAGGILTITLPAQVVAFGATFGWSTTKSGFQALTQITVSGNSDTLFSQVLTPGAATTPVYLGLAGTGSFSTITISSNFATGFGLNNFSYALESADTGIPEPGTMLLIGTGLFMVPLLKRLRRRRRA